MSTKVSESGSADDHDRNVSVSCPSLSYQSLISIKGTWAFMSVEMLTGRDDFRHNFNDDMESFFYVVLYAAVRWLSHNHVEDLGDFMTYYFNEYRISCGKAKGGSRKAQNMISRTFVSEFEWNCAEFAEWLDSVLSLQRTAFIERTHCDPTKLYEVWETIDAKNLSNVDRQVHSLSLPDETSDEEEFANSSISLPSSSTRSSLRSSGSKRSADVAALVDNTGGNKRLRRSERLARRRIIG